MIFLPTIHPFLADPELYHLSFWELKLGKCDNCDAPKGTCLCYCSRCNGICRDDDLLCTRCTLENWHYEQNHGNYRATTFPWALDEAL